MKNVFVCCVVVALASLASCKKDYQCECDTVTVQQYTDENGDPMGDPVVTQSSGSTTITAKEQEAKDQCQSQSGTINQEVQSGGIVIQQEVTSDCSIK
jgi:hypothetical protein